MLVQAKWGHSQVIWEHKLEFFLEKQFNNTYQEP